jgi:hypothetical protein
MNEVECLYSAPIQTLNGLLIHKIFYISQLSRRNQMKIYSLLVASVVAFFGVATANASPLVAHSKSHKGLIVTGDYMNESDALDIRRRPKPHYNKHRRRHVEQRYYVDDYDDRQVYVEPRRRSYYNPEPYYQAPVIVPQYGFGLGFGSGYGGGYGYNERSQRGYNSGRTYNQRVEAPRARPQYAPQAQVPPRAVQPQYTRPNAGYQRGGFGPSEVDAGKR